MKKLESPISLLRRTKLARFDPTLQQVYEKNAAGEWGTKAPIPRRFPSTYITLTALDSKYHVPLFKLADTKMAALERFVELAPTRVPNFLDNLTVAKINPAMLSVPEFQALCLQRKQTLPSLEVWRENIRTDWKMREIQGPVFRSSNKLPACLVYGRPIASFDRKTLVNVGGFIGVCSEVEMTKFPVLTLYTVHRIVWSQLGTPYIELSVARSGTQTSKEWHPNSPQQRSIKLLDLLTITVQKLMPHKPKDKDMQSYI